MRRFGLYASVALASCTFTPRGGLDGDAAVDVDAPGDGAVIDAPDVDAAIDAPIDAPADAPVDAAIDAPIDAAPCVPGFVDLCGETVPTAPLTIGSDTTVNTDSDPRCRVVGLSDGRTTCLLYGTTVSITARVTATGARPLTIAATTTLTIGAGGVVDVSSRRGGATGAGAGHSSCAHARAAESDRGGAGGGAGGSFATAGGSGGLGDDDNSLGSDGTALPALPGGTAPLAILRGGCPGSIGGAEGTGLNPGAAGGAGGGAVYLAARGLLTIGGQVLAAGAAGSGALEQAGGGGGGAGGAIVVQAPMIRVSGIVNANGGGGGEGGNRAGGPETDVGNPGTDGVLQLGGAPGGSGGDGGNGGRGASAAGNAGDGTPDNAGAGGGGGGGGYVRLLGTTDLGGAMITPAPS